MRHCANCDNPIEDINAQGVTYRRKVTSIKGTSSSGCSICTFWYCSVKCEPKNDDELPSGNCGMIVGEVISTMKLK